MSLLRDEDRSFKDRDPLGDQRPRGGAVDPSLEAAELVPTGNGKRVSEADQHRLLTLIHEYLG